MTTVTISTEDLQRMLTAAAEAGAAKVAAMLRPAEDLLSQREAWNIYGRGTVEGWVESGLVKPQRGGTAANSKRLYSRAELQTLATAKQTATALVRRYKSHRQGK